MNRREQAARPSRHAHTSSPFVFAASMLLAGCGSRPVRFADRPPVTVVADDAPIAMPRPTPFIEALYLSDLFVRAKLLAALDPTRTKDAGDVNAMDEVPRSAWFDPSERRSDAAREGRPVPAFTVITARPDMGASLAILDSRARPYALYFDPPDRPSMRTAAAVIASRLVRELGYLVAESDVVVFRRRDLWQAVGAPSKSVDDVLAGAARRTLASGASDGDAEFRAVATRWPVGVDLGTTPPSDTRRDDPNDRVPHRDRRTLRALRAVAAWLGITRFDTHVLRDAYVGEPGAAHVLHFVVGLDGALGADAVIRESDAEPEGEGGDPRFWVRFLTLGLSPKRTVIPTQTEHPALGAFDPRVSVAGFSVSPPFEPFDRALPGDLYWIAKRIAAIDPPVVDSAITAAAIDDPIARDRLRAALFARQRAVVAQAFSGVTPCELDRVSGDAIVLRDEAIRLGYASQESSRYDVVLTDDTGVPRAPAIAVAAAGPEIMVPIPARIRAEGGYVIARVVARRGSVAAPRSADFHVILSNGPPRVVGVRH
jgi:hypothetical protein